MTVHGYKRMTVHDNKSMTVHGYKMMTEHGNKSMTVHGKKGRTYMAIKGWQYIAIKAWLYMAIKGWQYMAIKAWLYMTLQRVTARHWTCHSNGSYLSNRTQTVTINNKLSQPTLLKFGVPQGSVLGPILFILYTKPLTTLIRRHSISNQSFADDTQLHDSCRPDQIDTSVQGMQDCISDVKT